MRQLSILIVLLSLLGFAMTAQAASEGNPDSDPWVRVSRSQAWTRLLHYRKTFLGKLRSDLDGPEFFFSPEGKTDSLAELKASAEAFGKDLKVGKLKQHPQCAFPERYRFVKKELGLKIADVPCPMFEQFLERFHHPKSITFIFSNAYPDNPASMFGHTFLRINAGEPREGSLKKLDLLDQGVSFAANVGSNENPLVFYWLGVTGGYPGAFTVIPYYAKVNEYNNAEARDLWEYDLALNEEQTMSVVRHLWELETNSYFDYYFFDENCAFQLLSVLEVARPDWELTDKTSPWVIPGETVKIITRTPGAVTDVKFRPSFRRKMLDRFDHLSVDQKKQLFAYLDGKTPAGKISDQATIDAVTAFLFYEKQKGEGKLPKPRQELLTQALLRRSELGSASEPERDPASLNVWNTRPDLGHDAARFGLTSGVSGLSGASSGARGLFFQELHWRSAYHDLLNNDLGYLRFSQIEFPSLTLRYYPSRADFRVEEVGLLSILSLFPLQALEKKPSWGFKLDYGSPKDFGCLDCHTLRGRGGIGLATEAFTPRVLVYGMALANVEAGESLRKGYRLGPGAQLATVANPFAPYKVRLSYQLFSDLGQEDRGKVFYQADLDQSLSLGQDWEARASWSLYRGYDEGKLSLNYYF